MWKIFVMEKNKDVVVKKITCSDTRELRKVIKSYKDKYDLVLSNGVKLS